MRSVSRVRRLHVSGIGDQRGVVCGSWGAEVRPRGVVQGLGFRVSGHNGSWDAVFNCGRLALLGSSLSV
jgi:hypothetical protein